VKEGSKRKASLGIKDDDRYHHQIKGYNEMSSVDDHHLEINLENE